MTDDGDARKITAGFGVIVMPDGGHGGWCNFGLGRATGVGDLPHRTARAVGRRQLPDHENRALAGLSMGGFGVMSYAASHPGLFAEAASFSGAVDLNSIPATLTVEAPLADLRIPTAV
ncbi:MAG TPA: alpha/beta hydrolase-fold protein [Amycolatopsis sp.]|uniref:alpha/beta hydrolase-fold protein n=1 Tax=Amycolatopsis sp. TaxID=37632 RepID=UPI002B4A4B64|nr:alpha/beta hydrolase-fold protein [Amycolatopsis sp.]HKS49674.1 alpha/beta hydrolase-fold protein [Amycolatopsis sp.]